MKHISTALWLVKRYGKKDILPLLSMNGLFSQLGVPGYLMPSVSIWFFVGIEQKPFSRYGPLKKKNCKWFLYRDILWIWWILQAVYLKLNKPYRNCANFILLYFSRWSFCFCHLRRRKKKDEGGSDGIVLFLLLWKLKICGKTFENLFQYYILTRTYLLTSLVTPISAICGQVTVQVVSITDYNRTLYYCLINYHGRTY